MPASVVVSCGAASATVPAALACSASAPSKPSTTSASAFATASTPSTGTTATVKPVAFVNSCAVSVGSWAPPTSATVTVPDPLRGVGASIVPCPPPEPAEARALCPGTIGAAKGSCGALDDTDGEQAATVVEAATRAESAKSRRARAMRNPSDGDTTSQA